MPTNATLVDVCLLDERDKVLQAPLTSASAAKWLRAQRRLRGVLRLKSTARSGSEDDWRKQQHREWTLPGFRSEVGRLLGRNDVDWILDRQVWRNRAQRRPENTRTQACSNLRAAKTQTVTCSLGYSYILVAGPVPHAPPMYEQPQPTNGGHISSSYLPSPDIDAPTTKRQQLFVVR